MFVCITDSYWLLALHPRLPHMSSPLSHLPLPPNAFTPPFTNKATAGRATKIPYFLPLALLRDHLESGCCQRSPDSYFHIFSSFPTCWIMGWPGGLYGPMPMPGQRQTHRYVVKATYTECLFFAITAFCTFLCIALARLFAVPPTADCVVIIVSIFFKIHISFL